MQTGKRAIGDDDYLWSILLFFFFGEGMIEFREG